MQSRNICKETGACNAVTYLGGIIVFAASILLMFLCPASALCEVFVHDMIARKGEEVMLKAVTRGKFFRKGGEVAEFIVNGRSIGKNLSGGDGVAFRQFRPSAARRYSITVKAASEEDRGILLVLEKGDRIIFVDVEAALLEGTFSQKPRRGSQEIIAQLSKRFPVVFLQTGMLNERAIKSWLKENGFRALPVIPWDQGRIFHEIREKGIGIHVIIGSSMVIESAGEHAPRAFSFGDAENAQAIKSWQEIGRKLKKQ